MIKKEGIVEMAKIQCKYCGDILEGDGKGTYIQCSCGKCAIDETPYYYRIIANFEDYETIEPKEEVEEDVDDTDIYIKVFNYFGYDNQRRKLTEEIQELNDEILLYEKGIGNIEDVITETADVLNIIKGFMIEYDITGDELREKMKLKMKRTDKRIDNGYYESRKGN